MHALLLPIGSHGDVHPFVGLGLALQARGHRVTLATNEHFAGLAARAGLPFVATSSEEDYARAIESPDLWDPMKGFRLVTEMCLALMEPTYRLIREHDAAGDLVMVAPVTAYGARIAQEAHRTPLVTVDLQPVILRSAITPGVLLLHSVMKRLPPWARRLLFRLLDATVVDPLMMPRINRFRATLGLPRARRLIDWWHSTDRIVGLFPDWYAPPPADWPAHLTLAGFPLFDEADHSEIDPEVDAFLGAGPPPVVFTAGSAMRHGAEFFRAAAEACATLGRRGLLLARFADQIPADLPPGVRHFAYVPFGRLLPRAAALVHHGGIGTTAQGLAAGLPQLVMPLAHDQPDNAARLERLGVGRSLPPERFRGPAVAEALAALLDDPATGAAARVLAARVDRRRALDIACDAIEATSFRPAAATPAPP